MKKLYVVVVLALATVVAFCPRFWARQAEKDARAEVTVPECPEGSAAVVVEDVFTNQWAVSSTVTFDGAKRNVASSAMSLKLLNEGDVVCVKDSVVNDSWPVDIVALIHEQPANKEE